MPVSGWVVVCSPSGLARVEDTLRTDPRVLVGTPQGAHLPVAYESDELDPWQSQREEWLAIEGVLDVALVSLDFRDMELHGLDAGPLMRRKSGRRNQGDDAHKGGAR